MPGLTTTLSAPSPEDSITLLLETPEGEQEVSVVLDFTDLTATELVYIGGLLGGDYSDPSTVTCAFIFVKALRQVELTAVDFPAFLAGLKPVLEGNPENLIIQGAD